MAQDLEMIREDGTVVIEQWRGWGWGVSFLLAGGFFAFGGLFCAATGQHLPHMSSLITALWALVLSAVLLPLGWGLTKNGVRFSFSSKGVRVDFFRFRAIHWFVDYPLSWLKGVAIENQGTQGRIFRVVLDVQNRPNVTLAEFLPSEDAWQLASAVAEPAMLSILER